MEDIKYKWGDGLNKSALDVAPNIELPQFKYDSYELIERQFRLSTGLYSRLTLKLKFVRSLGYYIIQIYIPSTLIVVLSWVSFWLDRTAAPARVSLGITTVLTMVTFIWSTNASLPKISYVKGIDVYLVCCFFMTFSSVIEYAMVSYVHLRHERRKRKKNQLLQEVSQQNELHKQLVLLRNTTSNMQLNSLGNKDEFSHGVDINRSINKTCPSHSDLHADQNSPILWDKKYLVEQAHETHCANPSHNHHHHHHQQQQQQQQYQHHHHNHQQQNNYLSNIPIVNEQNSINRKGCNCSGSSNSQQCSTNTPSNQSPLMSPRIVNTNLNLMSGPASGPTSPQTPLSPPNYLNFNHNRSSLGSNFVNQRKSSQKSTNNNNRNFSFRFSQAGGYLGGDNKRVGGDGSSSMLNSPIMEGNELANSLMPLNMKLLNESQQKIPSLIKQ
jgi:hypothetical protein